MIKRCNECSTTIDAGNLCVTCYNLKLSAMPRLVPKPNAEVIQIAEKIMKEQNAVLKKLDDNAVPSKGTKHDALKPDLSILPIEALEAMAAAFTYGSKKYARNNYKQGLEVNRTLAAALRHIFAFLNKEDRDTESGLSHLSHALAAVAMTVYNLKHNPKMDDR